MTDQAWFDFWIAAAMLTFGTAVLLVVNITASKQDRLVAGALFAASSAAFSAALGATDFQMIHIFKAITATNWCLAVIAAIMAGYEVGKHQRMVALVTTACALESLILMGQIIGLDYEVTGNE